MPKFDKIVPKMSVKWAILTKIMLDNWHYIGYTELAVEVAVMDEYFRNISLIYLEEICIKYQVQLF